MRVILVRHGQTDWNEGGIFRGRIDVALNRTGIRQAEIIAEVLDAVPIDAVYSSPLSRAFKTAQIIARHHDMPVQAMEAMTDIDFGEWQGLKRDEAASRYPDTYEIWETRPEKVEIPGAETLADVRKRLLDGLNDVFSKHPEGTVVIVSHGLTNKVLLCAVLGLDNSHFWKVKQDNGAINIFKYTAEGSKVFLMNGTTHFRSIGEIVEDMQSIENPLG
jgi:broad specificity phosphatase PhoE